MHRFGKIGQHFCLSFPFDKMVQISPKSTPQFQLKCSASVVKKAGNRLLFLFLKIIKSNLRLLFLSLTHPKPLLYESFSLGIKMYGVLLHSAVFPLSFYKLWPLLGIHCTDYSEKITLIILFTLKPCLLNQPFPMS